MAEAKSKKTKYISLFLRLTVIVGGIIWAVLWFSSGERWDKLTEIFIQMNLWIFISVFCIFLFTQAMVGLRWWLLLRSQAIFIPLTAAVRLHFLGLFYNNCMPGSVGGDLVRAWYVTRHTDKKFEAALSVFVDRVIGLISTLIIAIFFYSLFLRGKGALTTPTLEKNSGFFESISEYKKAICWVITAIIVAFAVLLLNKKTRLILTKIGSAIRKNCMKILAKFYDAIIIYCRKPLTITAVFVLTVILQIGSITGFWLLGSNIGIDVSIKYYYVFFTLSWVLGAVPVSIGGAVVVEVFLASLFIRFAGTTEESASALALCQRGIWILASMPGAAIHLVGAHLPKDFSIDEQQPIN